MDAGVVGELGMERRGEDLALAQATTLPSTDVSTVAAGPTSATNGPRMNTSGKSLSTMSAGAPAEHARPVRPRRRNHRKRSRNRRWRRTSQAGGRMRCAARRRQARRSRRCRRYRACGPAESCRCRYRTPVCRRRYALQSARTGRWSAAACPAWCFRRQAESRDRSNHRNPRRHAAVSTARPDDPASRHAQRTRLAPRECQSRHVSRLRRGRFFLRNVFNCYNHYRSCAFGCAGSAVLLAAREAGVTHAPCGPSLATGGHDGLDFVLVDADHGLTEVLGQACEQVASCQLAVACTMAAARLAGSPDLKMPEPTNTPSAPSSIMRLRRPGWPHRRRRS